MNRVREYFDLEGKQELLAAARKNPADSRWSSWVIVVDDPEADCRYVCWFFEKSTGAKSSGKYTRNLSEVLGEFTARLRW